MHKDAQGEKRVYKALEGAIYLRLNANSDFIKLSNKVSLRFEDLAQSSGSVCLQNDKLIIHAKLPESQADHTWVFNTENSKSEDANDNLESLLYRARVSLNGKW